MRRARGQATVELLAAAPLAVAVVVALAAAFLQGVAAIQLEHALDRGAAAAAAGADPASAALASLPAAYAAVADARVRGGVLRVRIALPGPLPALRGTERLP
jgi:hypothetical protein